MYRDPMIVGFMTGTNKLPATFLFFQIKTGGVGKEEQGDQHASQTEPRHHIKFRLRVNVVVQDGCGERAELAAGGRKAMGRRPNGCRIYLSSDEKGDRVRTELVEEGRKEVHGLEAYDVLLAGKVLELERWNNKEKKVHGEANHLHFFAAV